MFVAERGGRMPDSYGARLRQQREERGIALAAIAKQTRIKEALLEALEHDDLSQWPNGFYRRAFFRAYAAAIHLDPDAAFREFQALHPEPPEVDVMQAMAATLGRGEGNGRSTALRSAMGSAISSLSRLRRAAPEESAPAADAPLNGSLQLGYQETGRPAIADSGSQLPPISSTSHSSNLGSIEAVPLEPPAVQAEAPRHDDRTPASPASAEAGVAPVPAPVRAESGPDLLELARLCAEFGCITTSEEAELLLREAGAMLDATGLIVWVWNPRVGQLYPALFHGYSRRVVAQLPLVRRDDTNATAVSFRTSQTRVISDAASGECAFVVPLRTATGCVGAFAVELRRGLEATKERIAVATVLATQLAPIADCMGQPEQLTLPHAVNGAVQTV
jgi:transcriptional regulator with XRE-family HTH domain